MSVAQASNSTTNLSKDMRDALKKRIMKALRERYATMSDPVIGDIDEVMAELGITDVSKSQFRRALRSLCYWGEVNFTRSRVVISDLRRSSSYGQPRPFYLSAV